MKGQIRRIVAVLLAVFAAVGVAAIATDGLSTLENVKVGGIRIVIDNKEFTCTDANGAVVEPMIYNGTTYIPVRAVSTAFGKAVYWDGEESTIYLGNMDGKLKVPTLKMLDAKNIAENSSYLESSKNVFDNYGNYYSEVAYSYDFFSSSYRDTYQVLLDKKYSKFKATLLVVEGDDFESDFITIIGDEKVLFKSEEMNKTSKPIDIEVNVSGINDFKILFNTNANIRIANAGFYQ